MHTFPPPRTRGVYASRTLARRHVLLAPPRTRPSLTGQRRLPQRSSPVASAWYASRLRGGGKSPANTPHPEGLGLRDYRSPPPEGRS